MNRPAFLDKGCNHWSGPERIAVEAAVEQIIIQLLEDADMRKVFARMYGQEALDALLLG